MNSSLLNKFLLLMLVITCISWAAGVTAKDDEKSYESSEMVEVFLSTRVSVSNKVPLHFTGINSVDSLQYAALDTLQRVLTRDLTLSGLFNLRLPNLPVDNSRKNPLADRMTYLDGKFSSDSSHQVEMHLRMPYGAAPFWSETYRFVPERARSVAHRIAAEVIRRLTGEPSVMQTRIAYVVQMGPGKELYSSTFDGFDHQRHTSTGVSNMSPVWSPDGKRIAFTSFINNQADIFIMNVEDNSYVPFAAAPGVDQAPDWSPDGKWIAYSSSVDGNSEIYVRQVEGSETRRLTFSWAIETSPSWSPTGHEIAFVSDRLGNPQIFIMEADGSNQRRLTWEGNYNTSPAWSPRGDLIAYVRRDIDGFQIFVTDPQGKEHLKLTTGPGNNMDPCWSPDGLKLAVLSNRTGRKQIYTMDLYGRHQMRISDRRLSCSSPTWSPVLEADEEFTVNSQIAKP
ncbi:DPP IV N-terminal domain-containing protein [bacterium]|nr:DPP IV N-terminal domain-containing protein [bacterium]